MAMSTADQDVEFGGGTNYTDSWFEGTPLTPEDIFVIAAMLTLALSATRLYLEVRQ